MENNQEWWNQPQQSEKKPVYRDNKRVGAGIMAILLAGLGIHKFYLGYNKEGFIYLAILIFTCGIGGVIMSVLSIVEGIIYLTKSDDEFYHIYQEGKKTWF